MKAIYNFKTASLAIFALVILLTPTTRVFAITTDENSESENQPTTLSTTVKNACTRATNLSTTSDTTVLAHISNMKADFASRLTSIDAKQSEVKQKIYTKRSEIADKFQAKIVELRAIEGLTEEQLTAIDNYEADMIAAMGIRETAVDKALSDYQTALTELIKNHQADLLTATTTFETSVNNAFTKIKSTCASGTDISSLKTSIKEARQKLVTARQSSEYKTAVKQLQETRNSTIKAANDAFKKSAAEYKATLMKVLSTNSTTTTDTEN